MYSLINQPIVSKHNQLSIYWSILLCIIIYSRIHSNEKPTCYSNLKYVMRLWWSTLPRLRSLRTAGRKHSTTSPVPSCLVRVQADDQAQPPRKIIIPLAINPIHVNLLHLQTGQTRQSRVDDPKTIGKHHLKRRRQITRSQSQQINELRQQPQPIFGQYQRKIVQL